MKYEKEVKEILHEQFYSDADFLDEQDFDDFLQDLFAETGLSLEILSSQIEEGVNNGYSVEQQKALIKKMFSKE